MRHSSTHRNALLDTARRLNQQGRWNQALPLYRGIVQRDPGNLGVWLELAQLHLHAGDARAALAAADRVLEHRPELADAKISRARALQGLGNVAGAESLFESLAQSPTAPATLLCELAQLQAARGDRAAAIHTYQRAVERDADCLPALVNLSLLLEAQGDIQGMQVSSHGTLAAVEKLLAIEPDNTEWRLIRGNALRWTGRFAKALEDYEAVVLADPRNIHALINRAHVLHDVGDHAKAVEAYAAALAVHRSDAQLWTHYGNSLAELGRHDQALQAHQQALRLAPDSAEAHCSVAAALQAVGRSEEALAAIEAALRIDRNHALSWSNRSALLANTSGHDAEAINSAQQGVDLDPHSAMGHLNLGVALTRVNRIPEAIAALQKALQINPGLTVARTNLGYAKLLVGDFSGFAELEARWDWDPRGTFERDPYPNQRAWLGKEPIAGRKLLLHSEQGLGDTVQFCRYAPLLAQAGARVILHVQPSLVSLLRSLPGIHDVVGKDQPAPHFDLHCPLMSLPLALGTTVDTIPSAACYLGADPQLIGHWAQRLGPRQRGRIGLVWSGNRDHQRDHERSLPLARLLEALPPGYDYVGLQRELRDSDRAALQGNDVGLLMLGEQLRDFADTAAVCTLMDLVISVDTSVAHIAGAVGTNTWLLLASHPDFRWMLDRIDSPWYPTFTLLRQQTRGDWSGVLELVRSSLASA